MNIKNINILKPLILVAFSFFITTTQAQVSVSANPISIAGSAASEDIVLSKEADSLRVVGLNGTSVTAGANSIQFNTDTVHVDLTVNSNLSVTLGNGNDIIGTKGAMDLTGNSITVANTTENMIHNGVLTTDQNVVIGLSDDFTGTGSITLSGGTADLSITATDTIDHSGAFNADVITLNGGDILNNGVLTSTGNLSMTSTRIIDIQSGGTVAGATTMSSSSLTMGANINSTGSITIGTDAITGLNLTSSSSLSIEPTTASTTIGIGNTATGALNIDATEITGLTNGFSLITIGNTGGTGAIDIQASSFTDPLTIEAGSGVTTLNGTLTNTGNTVIFNGDLTITANQTITSSGLTVQNNTLTTGVNTLTSSGNVTLNTEDWQLTANGTTVGQFGAIDVTGTVTLTNSTLTLSGSHTASGADAIVIINNDGADAIVGTFNGLTEGATVGNGFTITYVGGDGNDVELLAAPSSEMNILGNAVTILDGAPTPNTGNFTDFGSVNVLASSPNTFTIQNTGAVTLNLTGVPNMVFITGADASQFSVTAQPTGSTVAGSGTETFTITFSPTSSGLKQAEVFIYNDDADENPYNFAIQGTGLNNEIDVTGLGVSIADGSNTPSTLDDTDFGGSLVGSPVPHTFTIENLNLGPNLNINSVSTSGANFTEFVVSAITTPASIAGGANTTFVITFTPGATGIRFAEVTIVNDDDDENPYTFTVQGNGLSDPEIDVLGNAISITDNDLSPSTTDNTDFGSVTEAGVTTIVKVFTIENTGGGDLTLNNIVVGGGSSC